MPEQMQDNQSKGHICTAIIKTVYRQQSERSGKLPNCPEAEAAGLAQSRNSPSEAPIGSVRGERSSQWGERRKARRGLAKADERVEISSFSTGLAANGGEC